MNIYYLMNKNKKLVRFHIEEHLGTESVVEDQHFVSNMPIGFTDVETWLEKRDYAKHKEHFQKWLKDWGMDTVSGFISATHCLGLNDTLWVKPEGSSLEWEQINLYNNPFQDVAAQTAFDTGLYGLQFSSTSPEFTAEGSFAKFWKQEGGSVYLYKAGATGAANVGLEPYSEYISSNIAQQISKQNVVPYDLVKYKGKICSKCEMFTNEDVGFVPFYKIIDANKHYTIPKVIDICRDLGFEHQCAEMFFIDSVVFNQDRHLGNFGFLVNNDTFEIVDFAPLFDFNISMLCNAMDVDLNNPEKYFEEYRVGHKLGGTFQNMGSELQNAYGFSLAGFQQFPSHPLYNMDSTRMEKILDVFNNNVNQITGRHSVYQDSSLSNIFEQEER